MMELTLRMLLALCIMICVFLPKGSGLPAFGRPSHGAGSASRRVRTKRCSCNNWLDRECIYFCHLDIIWVNTPSKTTPYGLGSPLSRRRRSTNRCTCTRSTDPTCTSFCRNSAEKPELLPASPLAQFLHSKDRTNSKLVTSLREMVRAKLQAVKMAIPPRRKGSGVPSR